MEDWQLIQEFVTENSERAFRDLVDRHLNLVHSVALRQVRDAQLAEEITQAVFILLARKAGSLHKNIVLAGWLYRTTRFVAARALRAEQRRQRREQEAFQMQQISSSDDTWRRMAPMLDEAIEQLGKVDRDAVILRFFQAEPFHKVGAGLGISEEAARKRVDRSLEKLRSFFAHRGLAITTTVLAVALAEHSAEAAPVTLGKIIASKAFAQTAAGTTALPVLVKETLSVWSWARAKLMVGLGAAGVVAALLTINGLTRMSHNSANAPTSNDKQPTSSLAAISNVNVVPVSKTDSAHLAFQAVDGRTGRGVAGAKVLSVILQDQDHITTRTDLVTDSEGRCEVPLVYSNKIVGMFVGALADGFEQRCAVLGHPDPVPAQYVLKLPPGSRIGGVVQNEAGEAVAGAKVFVQFFGTGDYSGREFQRERPGFPSEDLPAGKTDASGRWTFGSAPETNGEFLISVKHPDYPSATFQNDSQENSLIQVNRLKLEELHAGNAVMILKRGPSLRGVVTDEQHNPIPGATVRFGTFYDRGNPKTQTGGDGAFVLNNLAAGSDYITITAKNYAPERMSVEITTNLPAMTIQLKPGGLLRLQVVDENGGGVAHARVQLQAWHGNNSLEWGGFTDYQGQIEWDSAPRDQMDICAMKDGYFYSRGNMIVADGVEHTITLHKQLTISGSVTDADTKQPVTSFKVIPGSDGQNWDRLELAHGTNGQYKLVLTENRNSFLIRVEAEGYQTSVSEPLGQPGTNLTYDVHLKKADSNDAVRGVVLSPDGTPAAGAQVALCTTEKGVSMGRGKFLNRRDAIVTDADAEGRFTFPTARGPHTVVAVNAQGFGRTLLNQTNHAVSVQLEPWGRIEGVLKLKDQTVADQQILAGYGSSPVLPGEVSLDMGAFSTRTDDQGNFVFDQVPAGDLMLYLVPGLGVPMKNQTPVQVQAGATLHAQVGSTGRTLIGRFTLSGLSGNINWSNQVEFAYIMTKAPPYPMPPGLTGLDAQKWVFDYVHSEEGRARVRATRSFPLNIQSDGSFTIEDAVPGSYDLNALLLSASYDPNSVTQAAPLASIHKEIEVPELADNQSADPLDIGNVVVEIHAR